MKALQIKEVAVAGLIAAVYTVVSYFLAPISFGVYQVRIAEALTVLPFLTRAAIPGLFIGCLLANLLGGNGWVDVVFGSLLTLVAAIMTRGVYHASKMAGRNLLALLPTILLWLGAIYLLGEFSFSTKHIAGIVLSLGSGALIVWGTTRTESDRSPIRKRGVGSAIIVGAVAIWLMLPGEIGLASWIGTLLFTGSLLTLGMYALLKLQGHPPNLLLAPLPPVLLNAFGVAVYLAPIIGTEYWFTVQMIGVGQLVSCYVIGLPLLLFLKDRRIFR